jgi:predicted transcriptional regulator
MVDHKTLTVRLGGGDEERDALLDDIAAMERGEDVEDRHVLVLDDEADLQRLLSPANLGLLRAIREYEPGSMREAADLVERDFKEVHRNLTELEALRVIEFEQDGRSKRPVVRFDEIDVEVSLGSGDTDAAAA